MVASFVLLLKPIPPPPELGCKPGSGVGHSIADFPLLFESQGFIFRLEVWQINIWVNLTSLLVGGPKGPFPLIWLWVPVSLFFFDLVAQQNLIFFKNTLIQRFGITAFLWKDLGDFYPSFFIYNSSNGGLNLTGPSEGLLRPVFVLISFRHGNCSLVLCTGSCWLEIPNRDQK